MKKIVIFALVLFMVGVACNVYAAGGCRPGMRFPELQAVELDADNGRIYITGVNLFGWYSTLTFGGYALPTFVWDADYIEAEYPNCDAGIYKLRISTCPACEKYCPQMADEMSIVLP